MNEFKEVSIDELWEVYLTRYEWKRGMETGKKIKEDIKVADFSGVNGTHR